MLGSSSSLLDRHIFSLISLLKPESILELGCGQGKFAQIVQEVSQYNPHITAVQKLFNDNEAFDLQEKGYSYIIDSDILEYYKEGFDENFNLIIALDVIEHFLLSDAMSIINFSLYRSDYMLLVWPSKHPQFASPSLFDRHRCSFSLQHLANYCDIVFYLQTGFSQFHFVHQYHLALIRGFMNTSTFYI